LKLILEPTERKFKNKQLIFSVLYSNNKAYTIFFLDNSLKNKHNIPKQRIMQMKTVKAFKKDIFESGRNPVNLIHIEGDVFPQHEGDLTDIRHCHDFAELVIVIEGYGVHWIDGTEYPVAAGDVFQIQGMTGHYFMERRGLSLYNVMYDNSKLSKHLSGLRGEAGYNAMFILEPNYRKRHKFRSRLHLKRASLVHVANIAERMKTEQAERRPGYDTMLLSMLLELIIFLSREYSKVNLPQARALFRTGRIISRLEKGFREKWDIASLSKAAGMSKSSLIETFREATGCTPIDYLIRIRLQRAAELLIETSRTVSETATECGFSDSNYFSRQFRRIYGSSPRAFRKTHS
jgi:AraC-like DNA-binding protein/mannose-6-phosphate isomerase-like protein (cupin superfamily)